MWAQVMNLLVGLFLMFAPAIWSFDKPASDHHYIVAPLVITFAIMAIWEVNRNVRWFNMMAGAWLLISPLILGSEGTVAVIDSFCAILIMLFSLSKGRIKKRYGGGWRSLIQKNPVHLEESSKT